MRGWTLVGSIVVHLGIIGGVIVAPLFATVDLPEPRRAAPEYILVTAPMPPEPAPVQRRTTPQPSTSAAPVTPQNEILPEPPERPAATAVPGPPRFGDPAGEPAGNGLVPGGVVSGDPLPLPPTPPVTRTPVRPGGDVQPPRKIHDVAPRYPTIARDAHEHGIVILEAVIGEDGSVENVRVLRSKPLLDAAAIEAVRQWRFTPTRLNGQPVPVVMTVTVSFTLN